MLVSIASASFVSDISFRDLLNQLAPLGAVHRAAAARVEQAGAGDDAGSFPKWASIYLDADAVADAAFAAGRFTSRAAALEAVAIENARLPALRPPAPGDASATIAVVDLAGLADLLA